MVKYIYTSFSKYLINMDGNYFLNQYKTNQYKIAEDKLIFKRGSIGNWEYEIEFYFEEKRIIAWASNDSACVDHFDRTAKDLCEVPMLWAEALETMDDLMYRQWLNLASLYYRP